VCRENADGACNIRVEEGQRVITTGPYAIARHPMYGGILIMVIGVPLALGWWLGLLVLLLTIPVLVWRILDEERLLSKELRGYTAYMGQVPFRLVPFVWYVTFDMPARASVAARAVLGFAQLLLVLSIAVFGPAWTLDYWQAWLYLVVFAGCAAAITVYLSRTDPELLRRRLYQCCSGQLRVFKHVQVVVACAVGTAGPLRRSSTRSNK